MQHFQLRRSIAVFIPVLWIALPVAAQQTTGTVSGTVVDPSGAAVAGVSVRAISLATNVARDAKSDSAGNYSIPFLAAGQYRVTATLSGFQAQQVESFTLQVDQAARIDFTLNVGNVTESVNVSASAACCKPRTRRWVR